MVNKNKRTIDPFGQMLLEQLRSDQHLCEIMEREDKYIDTASTQGYYLSEYRSWPAVEKKAIAFAKGRVLDVGCGAGRHSLYLQQKGHEVTAIDISPGAVAVSNARGVKNAILRSVDEISKFKPGAFDTVIMMGNNFGVFGSAARTKRLLKDFDRITTERASIIAGSLNPHATDNPSHLRYHRLNKQRGRMAGQIRTRVRFRELIGEWFDYLLVSPEEMESLLKGSAWRIGKLLGNPMGNYFAVIAKVPQKAAELSSASARQTRRSIPASRAMPPAPASTTEGE